MRARFTRSVWFDAAIITFGVFVVAGVFSLVRGYGFKAWVLNAVVSVVAGGASAFFQVRRNRKMDEIVERARES